MFVKGGARFTATAAKGIAIAMNIIANNEDLFVIPVESSPWCGHEISQAITFLLGCSCRLA